MDSKNDKNQEQKAKNTLEAFKNAKRYEASRKAFSEYVKVVYDAWNKDNPLKRLKSKNKGRTRMVNAIREFQRGKLDLFETLASFYAGLGNISDKNRRGIGGLTVDSSVAAGIRSLVKGYKQGVWEGLNKMIKGLCSTLWGEKFGDTMVKYLKESTQKNGMARLLWPNAMGFWQPGEKGDYGVPESMLPSTILEGYKTWEHNLVSNMENDNGWEENRKGIATCIAGSKSLKAAVEKHNKEAKNKIEEDKSPDINKEHNEDESKIELGAGMELIIPEEDVDYNMLTDKKGKEEDVLEEAGIPPFLFSNSRSFGIQNIKKAAQAVKNFEKKEQDLIRGKLNIELGKAGFWN